MPIQNSKVKQQPKVSPTSTKAPKKESQPKRGSIRQRWAAKRDAAKKKEGYKQGAKFASADKKETDETDGTDETVTSKKEDFRAGYMDGYIDIDASDEGKSDAYKLGMEKGKEDQADETVNPNVGGSFVQGFYLGYDEYTMAFGWGEADKAAKTAATDNTKMYKEGDSMKSFLEGYDKAMSDSTDADTADRAETEESTDPADQGAYDLGMVYGTTDKEADKKGHEYKNILSAYDDGYGRFPVTTAVAVGGAVALVVIVPRVFRLLRKSPKV